MSYMVITSLPPEATAEWTCSRGFIKGMKKKRFIWPLDMLLLLSSIFISELQVTSDVPVPVRLCSCLHCLIFSHLIKHFHLSVIRDKKVQQYIETYYDLCQLSLKGSFYSSP